MDKTKRPHFEEPTGEVSPEMKARLEHAKRMERRSTVALVLAVLALLFS